MRTQITIDVEIEQLTCVRCGKTATASPWEFRRAHPAEQAQFPDAAPWRTTSWQGPEGWRRWEWPGGGAAASCADCWPDVEVRVGMFAHGLRRD